MAKYKQSSFIGGLNRQFDPTKIAENEYPLLFNGRVRNDNVETIQLPQELTYGLPEGDNFQGLYSAGFYLLAFIDGKCYYRYFGLGSSDGDSFIQLEGFQLASNVDRIYAELIPGSTVNFKRQLVTDGVPSSGVNLTNAITGSPDCVLVTDGINQPKVIFPDSTSRDTQTWVEWTNNDTGSLREYVPIGTFPLYHNGILYLAGLDISSRRLNKIFRSVTGRPLDFMVVIDNDGNKLALEKDGNADIVSVRADYNTITSLNRISSINSQQYSTNGDVPFLVGTAYNSYLLTPLTDQLLFGEPKRFSNRFLFSTGPLNPFCVIDEISGDTLLIDSKGIISFNAALLAQSEGRNEPFSRRIHPLFNGITQTVACCTKLDNYIYFGVNTVYGPAIIIYDEITQRWVSIDVYPGVNLVKQFAVISTTTTKRLFFITTDNKLYEAYASSLIATCRIYCGEWTDKETGNHQRVQNIQTIFQNILIGGEIHVSLFTDAKKFKRNIQLVDANIMASSVPLDLPFGRTDKDDSQHLNFGFQDSPVGYKHGALIEWNCKATLSGVEVSTSEINTIVDPGQQSLIEQSKTNLDNSTKIAFIGWAGLASSELNEIVLNIRQTNPDYVVLCGNNNLPNGALANLQTNVKNYWNQLKLQGRVLAALGPKDLDTLNGYAQLTYFTEGRYYRKVIPNSSIELFVLNTGYNSAGVIVEPDGITSTSKQALWLKDALATSFEKWKIVIVWDTPYYSSYFNDWLFKKWGASLVISARNQNYERLFQNQFNQINVGTGNNREGFASPISPYQQFGYTKSGGYFLIDCDSINLNGMFYASPSNEVVDQLQILG